MHIILSGYYGFDNVGDEAILFSIITALRSKQPNIKITVLSNDPANTRETFQVNAVNRHQIREINRVIKESDGLISGGGSLLQDVTGIRSIPYYTSIIHIAKWYKKPVFIYAQGMGPIHKKLNKMLVACTLNKVNQITVRDEKSKQLLQDIGINKNISIVPDPVFALAKSPFKEYSSNMKKPYITVSVRNWKSDVNYAKKIASCLDKLVRDGYKIVFVPMHGKHDELISEQVANHMIEPSETVPAQLSMEEKITVISHSQLLIGMRLHALIFSAITYTPFVAISYDPKIDAFTALFDQSVVGHVAKNDWSSASLYAETKEMLHNQVKTEELLKQKVTSFKKLAVNTAVDALKTFKTPLRKL